MIRKQTVTALYNRYLAEETDIATRVVELNAELSTLGSRLEEVRVIRQALQAQGADSTKAAPKKAASKKVATRKPAAKKAAPKKAASKKAASKKAAPKKAASKKAASKKAASKKAAPKKAAKPARTKPAVKGRRKAGGRASIHKLGIVDAALTLAKQKGTTVIDAGQVLDWFVELGYKSRTGTPTRNSIYVSLNREFTQGAKKGKPRVERIERGKFRVLGVDAKAAEAS